MRVLSDRNKRTKVFTLLVLSWGIIGIIMLIARPFNTEYPIAFLITTSLYFTTQSNLLITLVTLCILLGYKELTWFKNLALIALVNIFITGAIFHVLLTPYMQQVNFMNHVLHTINPILYIFLYFFFLEQNLGLKKFWMGLIYPLIYMVLIYIFIEPVLGNMMENIMPDSAGARYVYPFLDPNLYETGYRGLLIFNLGILAPLISIITLILMGLKLKLTTYLTKIK